MCFSLFFFFVDDDDDDDLADDDDDDLAVAVVVVVVVVIVSMFAVEVFVGFVMVDSLVGVFFFFPPLTTWVQPSSLLGLSPVLVFRGFVFVYFGRCCCRCCCYSCRCVRCVCCRFCCCCCCGRSCFWLFFEGRILKSAPAAYNSSTGASCPQQRLS